MVRKDKEQLPLFDNPHDLPRYDTSKASHTVRSLIKQGADPTSEPHFGDVSVTLGERADTLERAARMYADYNKLTIGLGKAVHIPEVLADLEERYGVEKVPDVVAGARNNSFYAPTESDLDFERPPLELRMLDGVLKYKDALAAGANPTELSAELQPLVVGIRHAIGTKHHDIDAKKRNAEIKKVRATANRAAKYSQLDQKTG